MADDSEIKVRVRADGASVKKAIAGITREVTAAEKVRAKEAAKAEREVTKATEKAAKERAKEIEKLHSRNVSSFKRAEQQKRADSIARAREILEDFRKNEKKKRDELQKTLREAQMSERQRAALIRRTEREIASSRQVAVRQAGHARAGSPTGRGMAVAGGIAAGGAALAGAGFAAVNRMAAAGGVRSREQLLQESLDFNRRLADLSSRSEVDAETLRSKINETATNRGVDQIALLERLEGLSTRFGSSAVQREVENLDAIARAAVGASVEMGALASASDTAAEVFGLTAQQAGEMSAFIVDIGDRGAIDAAELAEQFAPFLGTFQRAGQSTGVEGAQEALRFSALLGRGFTTASEAQTMGTSVLRSVGDISTQERLALATGGRAVGRGRNRRIEGGQRITEDGSIGGRVADPMAAVRAIMGNAALSRGMQQRILGDSQAFMGADILNQVSQTEAGQSIMGASAESGRALIDRGLAAQESVNGAGRDLDRARAESFADFQRNGDAYTRAVVRSTEEMGRLNATYPGAAEGLETLKDASMGLAGIFAAIKLAALGGAGSAAAGAGAGAAGAAGLGARALAMGGTAVGAAGVATTGAVAAGGLAAGLGIGRLLGEGVDMATGNTQATDASNEMFSALFSGDRSLAGELWAGAQEVWNGPAQARSTEDIEAGVARRAAEANTRALEDSAQANRELATALRERAADGGEDPGVD